MTEDVNANEGPTADNDRHSTTFEERMRNFIAADPSPRDPSVSKHSNPADLIERQMQADGHQSWGYVIYRTTYSNNTDWAECLRRIRYEGHQTYEMMNGLDVLALHQSTVFSDQALFDGVDEVTVRNHFKQWVETALPVEQPGASVGLAPRYRFCIQIDDECLRSIVHDSPPPESGEEFPPGWVKVINASWMLTSEQLGREPDPDDVFEPIGGITDSDVGWGKCMYSSIMDEYYYSLADLDGWGCFYRRPPSFMRW